jgi:hypothetical protein
MAGRARIRQDVTSQGDAPMPYRPIVLLVLSAMVAAGCSNPTSPVSPSSLGLGAGSRAAVQPGTRSFDFEGEFEGTYAGSGEPPFVTVHVEAIGTASHLGRFVFDSTHVVNFIDLSGRGTESLTAANGDQLTGEVRGQAEPRENGVFFIVETLTITGGTGRFAGASGEVITERLSFPGGPANGTTTGSLRGHVVVPR